MDERCSFTVFLLSPFHFKDFFHIAFIVSSQEVYYAFLFHHNKFLSHQIHI